MHIYKVTILYKCLFALKKEQKKPKINGYTLISDL